MHDFFYNFNIAKAQFSVFTNFRYFWKSLPNLIIYVSSQEQENNVFQVNCTGIFILNFQLNS